MLHQSFDECRLPAALLAYEGDGQSEGLAEIYGGLSVRDALGVLLEYLFEVQIYLHYSFLKEFWFLIEEHFLRWELWEGRLVALLKVVLELFLKNSVEGQQLTVPLPDVKVND